VLSITDDQRSFSLSLAYDENEAIDRRINRDEGGGPVIILARGNRAMPFAEVENCCTTLHADAERAKCR